MSRNISLLIVILVLITLGLGFWFFQSQKQQPTSPVLPTPAVEVPTSTPNATSSGSEGSTMQTIVVEGDEYKFTPSKLTLQSGQKVRLTFKNTGKLPHNLVIDDLGVAVKTIGGGKEDMVEFTASKTGAFSMYCSVGDHKSRGMEGNVSVF